MCSECAWISKHDTLERIASAEPCVLTSDQSPEASLRSLNPWSLPWPGDLHSAPWFSRWRREEEGEEDEGERHFSEVVSTRPSLCVSLCWEVTHFGVCQNLVNLFLSDWWVHDSDSRSDQYSHTGVIIRLRWPGFPCTVHIYTLYIVFPGGLDGLFIILFNEMQSMFWPQGV